MEKRNTIQKQMVLDAVAQLHNHPTAEEVYAYVAQRFPTISKATVYRNLSGLGDDGRLLHIRMPDGADRFDHTLMPHNHIACSRCGSICDVPQKSDEAIDRAAAAATGYSGVTHSIVFRGVCPACYNA